jgi:hypothetical protein
MGFLRFVANQLKNYSIPVFRSFFKAYKDTTSGPKPSQQSSSGQSSGKQILTQARNIL